MIQDLPEIPDSWRWGTLGEVVTNIEAGKSFKCEERPPAISELGIVKVSAVTWGTFDEEASKTCLSLDQMKPGLLISAGDFLFSRANTIQLVGACVIVHEVSKRLMLSDKILRLKFHSVHARWVLYALRSAWGRTEIERLATGNQESMRNIGQDRIRAIRIPLPPIDEQLHLVAEIEKQFTRLDAAESALAAAAIRLNRYRAAALEAATGSSEWKRVPLSEISQIQGGIQKQPKRAPHKNAYRFLRVANVLRGSLDLEDVHMIELFAGELDRLRLRMGDLLIVEGNGSPNEIGRMAVWDGTIENCVHQNHLIRARLNQDMSSAFVSAFWNSPSGRAAVKAVASSTSGLYTLSVRKVGMIPVPKPSLDEQAAAVGRIERQLSLVDDMAAKLRSGLKRARRLRQSILSAAFRGSLCSSDIPVLSDHTREVHAQ